MIDRLKDILRPYYPFSKTTILRKEQKKKFNEMLLSFEELGEVKIVIGSGQRYTEGWIPSEQHILDLLSPKTWLKYFRPNSIDGLLAEHVWEHLTPEQGITAVATCYYFLKKGGRLRVAVPDGFHPDQSYIDYVKPGGHGAGADDHKVLYNYKSISLLFTEVGFEVNLLEYFNENGEFSSQDWNLIDGYIHRSIRYDERNQDGKPNYTSLIIDAVKK